MSKAFLEVIFYGIRRERYVFGDELVNELGDFFSRRVGEV